MGRKGINTELIRAHCRSLQGETNGAGAQTPRLTPVGLQSSPLETAEPRAWQTLRALPKEGRGAGHQLVASPLVPSSHRLSTSASRVSSIPGETEWGKPHPSQLAFVFVTDPASCPPSSFPSLCRTHLLCPVYVKCKLFRARAVSNYIAYSA